MTVPLGTWQLLSVPSSGSLPKKLLLQLMVPVDMRWIHFVPAPYLTSVEPLMLKVWFSAAATTHEMGSDGGT